MSLIKSYLTKHFSRLAVLFIIVYFLFEAFLVSWVSLGAGLDDAELISNLSFWNWGYGGSQPPLYTWLAYGLTQLFGLHFTLLQVLKFSILGSTFLAVYAGLRLLYVRPCIAACAMLSVFLLPQISWESQRALIHSVMGTAGSAWCFAAFAGFARYRSPLWAVLFGLACAATILGKYNGVLFVLAVLAAGVILPQIRPVLKSRWLVLSLAVALLAMAPALVFIVMQPEGVVQRTAKFAAGASGNAVFDRLTGMLTFMKAGLNFTALALALALIIWLIGRWRGSKAEMQPPMLAERFVRAIVLAGLVLVALLVIVSGVTHIKDRWLQPVLFLAPVWLTLWLARVDVRFGAVKAFAMTGLVAALLVPPFLANNIRFNWHGGKPPQQNLDYRALDNTLKAHGPVATVLSTHPFIPGNLRLLDPKIKTLFAESPFASARLARPLVVVWEWEATMPQALRLILDAAKITPPQAVESIELGYHGAEKTTRRVYYVYLP